MKIDQSIKMKMKMKLHIGRNSHDIKCTARCGTTTH